MPLLKAIRQLHGDYGTIAAGELFECDQETAESLEARGLACLYRPPVARPPLAGKMMPSFDNKAVQPLANKLNRTQP